MLHYFAKLGRSPLGKSLMPMLAVTCSGGYIGFQFFGHNLVRNMFAAESEPGKRQEISKDLQKLITKVFHEIRQEFNQPINKGYQFDFPPPPIKWFASSTLDPIVMGMTETRTGVLIGLPHHYNYTKADDVPATFQKLNLFKSNKKPDPSEADRIDCESGNCNIGVITLDKTGQDWKNYVDSMVLSEKAKKFSIARELFMSDTYKLVILAGVLCMSFLLSISLSRAAVSKLGFKDAHLSQRIPFYGVAGCAGMFNFYLVSDATHQKYTKKADSRAIAMGEDYRKGAIEYFTKLSQRNKALRNLVEGLELVYDEEGNPREGPTRRKHLPIAYRLDIAKKGLQEKVA